MKKVIAIIAAAAMVMSFAGCGKERKSSLRDAEPKTVIGGTDAPTDIEVSDDKETAKDAKTEDKKTADNKSEDTQDAKSSENTQSSAANTREEEQEKVTPTFKYFVSGADADYDKTMKTIEALKSEYKDRVIFDIVNVDEDPQALENFAMVKDNTPYLIMLNTTNDICALRPKINSQKELKVEIDNALK
ncbi:MAG: hypothetical protein PUF72_01915 [Clostridiales bacterium]|nr:hypothetical protein [Clostridiales bacterium]